MSILDTFFFVFQADASGVQKGLDSGGKAADDLGKKLDSVDKMADKLSANFINMATSAGKALAGIVALGAIKATIQNTTDHTYAVAQNARAIGVNVSALSLWQNAVKSVGGSAEQATSTIATLHDSFVKLSAFGGQSFLLGQLGLNGKDVQAAINDPTIALEKLSGSFSKMNTQQQLFMGKKLGLDIGTITLLSKGQDALKSYLDRQRELGVVTELQAKQASEYKIQLAELETVYETIRRELTSDFLPALTWMFSKIEQLTLYFREHSTFAKLFFGGIATALTVYYIPAMVRAAVATWAVIGPFVAVGVAVLAIGAAFALVGEDIYAFLNGQNSVIGELSKKWPIIGATVRAVAGVIEGAFDLIKLEAKALWVAITEGPVSAFNLFAKGIDFLSDKFSVRFPAAAKIIQWFAGVVKEAGRAMAIDLTVFLDILKAIENALWAILKPWAQLTGGAIDWIEKKLGLSPGNAGPTSGGLPTPGTSKDQIARGKLIASKFEALGWSKEQAAGIAGSILQESGGDPNAVNKTSGAQGIEQWLGQRKKDFEAYIGHPIEQSTLDEQIQFANYEMTHGKEKAAGDRIRATKTAADAAYAHSVYNERSGIGEANNARRQSLAQDIAKGQTVMADTKTPLSAQTSQSVASNSNTKSLNVTTGPVTVNTAATDGKGVGRDMGKGLQEHYGSVIDHFDDGVAA